MLNPGTRLGPYEIVAPLGAGGMWHFLYFATPSNTIWLSSLDSNETTRLLNADSQAQYAAPGYLLFGRQGTLLAQPFDTRHAALTGEAAPIADQLAFNLSNHVAFSVSDNGVLAYRTGGLSTRTQLTWFDRAGKSLGPVGSPGVYRNPVSSPDGARLGVLPLASQPIPLSKRSHETHLSRCHVSSGAAAGGLLLFAPATETEEPHDASCRARFHYRLRA